MTSNRALVKKQKHTSR